MGGDVCNIEYNINKLRDVLINSNTQKFYILALVVTQIVLVVSLVGFIVVGKWYVPLLIICMIIMYKCIVSMCTCNMRHTAYEKAVYANESIKLLEKKYSLDLSNKIYQITDELSILYLKKADKIYNDENSITSLKEIVEEIVSRNNAMTEKCFNYERIE